MTKESINIFIKRINPAFAARIVLLVLFMVVIYLLRTQVSDITKKANVTLLNIAIQTQLLSQAAELQQQYGMYYHVLPEINALLPNQDRLPDFVAAVESVGREAGLDSTSIKFVGEPLPSLYVAGVKEIAITLNVGGTGTRFLDLFKGLAVLPYFINLTNIDIDAQGGIEGTALLKANGSLFLK